jgi:hypothetical protein
MRFVVVPLAFALTLPAPPALAAEEPEKKAKAPATDQEDAEEQDDSSYGHGGQFGLRAGLVGGYRMIFRYDESPFCAKYDDQKSVKDQQKFCGHAAPLSIDVGLSFAPLGAIEPFLWGRFGLSGEDETDTEALILIGAGARIYTMSDSAFKIFIEPAIGMELEDGRGAAAYQLNDPEYKTDVVLHLAAGPQLDVAKNFGFYADAGITTGILRSIHSTLELSLGVQARMP